MMWRSLVLLSIPLSALASLRAVDNPAAGWAWKDKDGHHEPEIAFPKKDVAFGASKATDAKKAAVSSDVVKKMTRSVNKMQASGASSGDLMSSLARDCEKTMQLKEFLPKCMARVKDLIAEIDYNYGDAQLEPTLRNYCQHSKDFPLSHGAATGFNAQDSCVEFAGDLWNARVLELKSQKTSGYTNFCTKFYEHHGGSWVVKTKKTEEPPKFSGASSPRMMLVAVVATLVAFFGY